MKILIKSIALAGLLFASNPLIAIAQDAPSTATQEALDPVKLAAASQLLDTVMPPESREAMIAAMATPLMQNITGGMLNSPELQKIFAEDSEIQNIFNRYIERERNQTIVKMQKELPNMISAMSRAYARQFSLQEMAEAKAFFSTSSGRAYMTKSIGIMADPDVAKWQQDMMSKMMLGLNDSTQSLVSEIEAYRSSKNKKSKK